MHKGIEQTRQYWISKIKMHPMGAQISALGAVASSYSGSWEEQAFAEDAGGCIWPPRSYSCSFCGREFRSAQALGGHMNVHRRDRARLKQSSSPSSEALEGHQLLNPSAAITTRYPQAGAGVYGTTSNPNPKASLLSPRFSALSDQTINWSKQTRLPTSFSLAVNRDHKKDSLLSPTVSFTDSIPLQLFMVPELELVKENSVTKEADSRRWRDPGEDDDEVNCKKRRRIDPMPILCMESSSGDQKQRQYEILKPNQVEELDLELRLGDAPKVK